MRVSTGNHQEVWDETRTDRNTSTTYQHDILGFPEGRPPTFDVRQTLCRVVGKIDRSAILRSRGEDQRIVQHLLPILEHDIPVWPVLVGRFLRLGRNATRLPSGTIAFGATGKKGGWTRLSLASQTRCPYEIICRTARRPFPPVRGDVLPP
jgi:hypothetical protein